MRLSGPMFAGCLALALAACGDRAREGDGQLHSALSERGWLTYCAHEDFSGDRATCSNRRVTWVVTLTGRLSADRLAARLGPQNLGVGIDLQLTAPLEGLGDEAIGRTMFVTGQATELRDGDGRASVQLTDTEVLGFQTMVGAPRQGPRAAEMTLAEFGRFCLLAPQETYTEQCAGKRIVWYGLLRGTAPDGVILGLPFEDASIARIKTAEPLTWPAGSTRRFADQPIVVEGVLAPAMARRENRERVPIVEAAHIVSFSQADQPVAEITGVD